MEMLLLYLISLLLADTLHSFIFSEPLLQLQPMPDQDGDTAVAETPQLSPHGSHPSREDKPNTSHDLGWSGLGLGKPKEWKAQTEHLTQTEMIRKGFLEGRKAE